jgi:hypothetical protein
MQTTNGTSALDQAIAIVLDALPRRSEPFTWGDAVLDTEALVDPSGCLPLLCCISGHHCAALGVPAPFNDLIPDKDASFNLQLRGFQVNPTTGFGAYLLVLRDVILTLESDLQIYQAVIHQYMQDHFPAPEAAATSKVAGNQHVS